MNAPAPVVELGSALSPLSVAPRPLYVSLFPNETTSLPEGRAVPSWEALVALIGPPQPRVSKKGQAMFSPAEWPGGAAKKKASVIRVHFGVLDLDDIAEDAMIEICAGLPCSYVLVSSWQHGKDPGLVRCRLIVPFSRPVEVQEWPRFWPIFSQTIGRGYQDNSCSDPSRCFFIPSHPHPAPAPPIYMVRTRQPHALDVDDLLARAPATRRLDPSQPLFDRPPASAHEAIAALLTSEGLQYEGMTLTAFDLRMLARKWSRAGKYKKWLSEKIYKICDGESFADDGERDTTLFKVSAGLAEAFPHASAKSLAAFMQPSLDAMGLDGPGAAEAIEKLRRKQAEPRMEAISRIAEFFNNKRATPYTEDEIRLFSALQSCTLGEFHRRWIVQRGRTFYLFAGLLSPHGSCAHGDYIGPYTQDDAANAARRELSPAVSAGVTFDVITEKSVRAKSITELVKDYGQVARKTIIDLTADYSCYDAEKRQFVEATAPLRDLTPLYNEQIDMWLFAIAGLHYERLCEWIAAVTLLRDPCAALYLEGAKGVGKSLLASGLARLWSDAPTDLDQALSSFNESLCHNPLVFGDEKVPTDARGRMRTSEIREFIQARTRVLKRKFQHPVTMHGCIRLILASNNEELLHTTENLTSHDIGAISERIFHLPVQKQAADVLETLKKHDAQLTVKWIEGDLIARHALYLRDTITIDRRNRFLVSGESDKLTRKLSTSSGARSAVCHWIVSWLLNPEKLSQTQGRENIRVIDGRVYVMSRALVEQWEMYTTNMDPPEAGVVARALAGISTGRTHLKDAKGRLTYFRIVDEQLLIAWAESAGYATEQTIREILVKGIS
jgi:hypothetical protein